MLCSARNVEAHSLLLRRRNLSGDVTGAATPPTGKSQAGVIGQHDVKYYVKEASFLPVTPAWDFLLRIWPPLRHFQREAENRLERQQDLQANMIAVQTT